LPFGAFLAFALKSFVWSEPLTTWGEAALFPGPSAVEAAYVSPSERKDQGKQRDRVSAQEAQEPRSWESSLSISMRPEGSAGILVSA